jgi:hypothetical protein
MTDTQLLTLCLAIIMPLSMLLYSNSRIGEAKETLRAEIKTLGGELRTDSIQLRADLNATLVRIENKIDHIAETQAVHSERLDRLEKNG